MKRPSIIHVLLLGLNLWAVAVWIPAAIVGRIDSGLGALMPGAALALGVSLLRKEGTALPKSASQPNRVRWLAPVTLFIAFPWSIGWGLLHLPITPSMAFIASASMSLLAYLWAAIGAWIPASEATSSRPLPSSSMTKRASNRWRASVVIVITAGAAALLWIAPWLDPRISAQRWGGASSEGAVVAALTGGILATATLTLFLGSTLRRGRQRMRRWRTQRFIFALLLTSLALALLAVRS